LYGSKRFEGIIPNLERRFTETKSDYVKNEINKYMSVLACPKCKGMRLRPESLAVKIQGRNIYQLSKLPVNRLKGFFNNIKITDEKKKDCRSNLKRNKIKA